jgi:hypothetical protein
MAMMAEAALLVEKDKVRDAENPLRHVRRCGQAPCENLGRGEARGAAGAAAAAAQAPHRQEAVMPKTAPQQRGGLGLCRHCGHAKGYHYFENARCSDRDCPCPGYESRKPSAWRAVDLSGD